VYPQDVLRLRGGARNADYSLTRRECPVTGLTAQIIQIFLSPRCR
jgi:hypothetical protein